MIFVRFIMLAFLIGSFLGGDRWDSWFDAFAGYTLGLGLGIFVSVFFAVANWDLLQEGVMPRLLSVMLAFSLADTVAYFLAAVIVSSQEQVRVNDKKDEVENPTLAL
jgi:phosphoglycerol transferase MdoB-like AlkP superfamily enzyme